MGKTTESKNKPVIVWGIAAGRGTTKDAAPGAFTWREYPSQDDIPTTDWQQILDVVDA